MEAGLIGALGLHVAKNAYVIEEEIAPILSHFTMAILALASIVMSQHALEIFAEVFRPDPSSSFCWHT